MNVLPIIFQYEMVQALLNERKWNTRRIAWAMKKGCEGLPFAERYDPARPGKWAKVQPGDLLYVRENWATDPCYDDIKPTDMRRHWPVYFAGPPKGFTQGFHRIRPSIHLPKWASRITLEVVSTKIEPLRSISEEDARAEGISHLRLAGDGWGVKGLEAETYTNYSAKEAFKNLWTHINGRDSWEASPLVVALRFKVHVEKVDAVVARMAA